MTGFELNERLGKIHFWSMFIAFNSTFGPLLVIGFLGMPRRVVTYAGYLQGANDLGLGLRVRARRIDARLHRQPRLVAGVRARPSRANPWGSKSIEFQLPSPVPVHDFDRIPTFGPDPYPYGVEGGAVDAAPPRDPAREADRMTELASTPPTTVSSSASRRRSMARNLAIGSRLGRARPCSSSSRSSSRTSTSVR